MENAVQIHPDVIRMSRNGLGFEGKQSNVLIYAVFLSRVILVNFLVTVILKMTLFHFDFFKRRIVWVRLSLSGSICVVLIPWP